jgi:Domain of unknown function (DUF5615)
VKLLLDEMMSSEIAVQLRRRKHDVTSVSEYKKQPPMSDPEVMDLARIEHRAVVTNNVRDFRILHAAALLPEAPGHYGIVFMSGQYRRTKSDVGRIISALEAKLREYPGDDDLASAETWL